MTVKAKCGNCKHFAEGSDPVFDGKCEKLKPNDKGELLGVDRIELCELWAARPYKGARMKKKELQVGDLVEFAVSENPGRFCVIATDVLDPIVEVAGFGALPHQGEFKRIVMRVHSKELTRIESSQGHE